MATNPYVNKVVYGNQTVMDITDTTAEPENVLEGEVFYTASGARSVGTAIGGIPEEELRDTVGWTGKNLADISKTEIGTAWNGTSNTARARLVISAIPNESYIVSICGTNNLDYVGVCTSTGIPSDNAPTEITGDSYQFTVASDRKYITIGFNKTDITQADVDALKIMLRKASISDSTYEPYHESVEQVLRDGEVIEGKNLLNPDILNVNDTGLTYAPIYVGNGDFTLSTTAPLNSQNTANLYLLAGNVSSGALTPTNGVYINHPITQTAINGYVTVASRSHSGVDIKQYNNQLEKGTIPTTYEPYYIPLKDSKFDRSEQRVLGAKNLLPNNANTQTINGVTFTVNSDGSVTASGTASADAILFVAGTDWSYANSVKNLLQKNKRYILSSGNTDDTANYYLSISIKNSSGTDVLTPQTISGASGSMSAIFTVPNTDNLGYIGYIYIKSGTTVNRTFKPMLRLASDPDDTYTPYAMTNKELTDEMPTSTDVSHWNTAYTNSQKVYSVEATLTSAVASGGYVYLPGGNNSSSWWGGHPDLTHYHIVPTADKGNGTPMKYTSCEALDESTGWKIRIKVAEDVAANTKIGAIISETK